VVEQWMEQSVSGEAVVVYALETRVRHKEFPELVGTIVRHERHESGRISPIPFFVVWDDRELARAELGMMSWYADADRVEPIEEEANVEEL
jgi:hypothetical protein